MNFPYVLSDEILLRSKYEKQFLEKILRSKWLSVTIVRSVISVHELNKLHIEYKPPTTDRQQIKINTYSGHHQQPLNSHKSE